jgi:hypothetical protein
MNKKPFYKRWWFLTIIIIILVFFYMDYRVDKCKLKQWECYAECGEYDSEGNPNSFDCKNECIIEGTNCIYRLSPFNRRDVIE